MCLKLQKQKRLSGRINELKRENCGACLHREGHLEAEEHFLVFTLNSAPPSLCVCVCVLGSFTLDVDFTNGSKNKTQSKMTCSQVNKESKGQ